MAINVSQAFKRTSANPIDESLALTKEQMLAVNDNLQPAKWFTVCLDDGKLYMYSKTNEMDPETGKFRVLESGGGGGGTSDYTELDNKPQINGNTLVGDKSNADLGIPEEIQYAELPTADAEYEGKIFQYTGATGSGLTHGHFYECVGDGQDPETFSWVEIPFGSSGGGGSLEDALTTSITVGGIESGTTYPAGTTFEQMFRDLLNPTAYPTLTAPSATLTATGAKLLEAGSTLSTVMTLTFSRGSINPAYGTSGYRSGEATGYSLDGGASQAENTFNVTVTSAKTSYQGAVSYGAGEQPKDSKGEDYDSPLAAGSVNSNTLTYEFVDALWANTANIATVAKLSLVSKSAKVKQFDFPAQTTTNPETFDVPASWTVTAVEVKNDLSGQWENASSQFAVTDTSHNDAAGSSVAYKRYSFSLGYATGARSVRVKWS